MHPSPEMIMESIKQKQMYILKANDVIDNNVAAEAFYYFDIAEHHSTMSKYEQESIIP